MAGDNPVQTLDADTLGRGAIALSFAQHVLTLDVTEGVVVGVLGAWGSGKTSFVNLARPEFERSGITVVDFNPWMFSGAEQLVESFFIELAAQLRIRAGLEEIGKGIEEYGERFSGFSRLPLIGPFLEAGSDAAALVGKILQRRKEGIGGRRTKLRTALVNYGKPIVVVVDDIDRLSSSEIRDVFKLVRLTASFPNIIYMVAFDRLRVETALGEEGVPGREYLEKILQVAVDLPAIPSDVLNRQIFAALDAALSDIEKPGDIDQQAWPDIFMEIVRPLVRHMRDVRRYAAAVRGTVQALEGQIALGDVLGLEAIRVFLPDVFRDLHGAVDGLITAAPGFSMHGEEGPELKAQVEGLLRAGKARENVVRNMVIRLFPAAVRHIGGSNYAADWQNRWLRERRVAHEDVLRLYLERAAGEGLQAFNRAEQAWVLMGDRRALDEYLRSIAPGQQEDVIGALEVYQDQFRPEHVVPGTIVLLNLLPDLPERQKGFFDFGTAMVVTRVTYRLLKSLADPVAVAAAVRTILPELTTLSAKDELITDVGYRENQGHKLVSELEALEFEKEWRDEVRAARIEKLLLERDLLKVLFVAKRDRGPTEPPLTVSDDPHMTLRLLKGAKQDVKTQTMGNRAVRLSPRLEWDVLVKIYGDEVILKQRLDELKATAPEGVDELIVLADKYAGGWRPTRDE